MEDGFTTNPQKAAAKININNILMAACLAVLTILWSFSPERAHPAALAQLVFAIPLLYVSSIAYTKIAYRDEVKWWDYLGWFTSTTATAGILNVFGILVHTLGYGAMALAYYLLTWALLLVYTLINMRYHPHAIGIKLFKFFYFVALQFAFGLLVPL